MLIACVLLAFFTGLAVQHYRQQEKTGAKLTEYRDAKR